MIYDWLIVFIYSIIMSIMETCNGTSASEENVQYMGT